MTLWFGLAAYVRNLVDNQWYCHDDSRVSKINVKEIKSSMAYVLFYKRKNAGGELQLTASGAAGTGVAAAAAAASSSSSSSGGAGAGAGAAGGSRSRSGSDSSRSGGAGAGSSSSSEFSGSAPAFLSQRQGQAPMD